MSLSICVHSMNDALLIYHFLSLYIDHEVKESMLFVPKRQITFEKQLCNRSYQGCLKEHGKLVLTLFTAYVFVSLNAWYRANYVSWFLGYLSIFKQFKAVVDGIKHVFFTIFRSASQ